MLLFILKRILIAVPTILVIIILTFLLTHIIPGNPFVTDKALSPEVLTSLMHKYRLDLPIWQQCILYLQDLLHGNLGMSYKFIGQSINELLFPDNIGGFWFTLRLASITLLIIVPLGIILGLYAGFYADSYFDKYLMIFYMFFNSVPAMVTGPLFVAIFAVFLHLLPASGFVPNSHEYLILPVLVLSCAYIPSIIFITRSSIISVLNTNFIRFAKAKGLSNFTIMFKHAISPTLLPVISNLGPMFVNILVGAIVTEQVFALPGVGVLTTNAAINRDYSLILAITICSSILTIFFNLLIDILYFMLDPRIKNAK